MDWIFDNFQIVALVGIAFASWLKHRLDTKMAEREEQRTNEDEEDYDPADDWEARQNQPSPSVPPPLVWPTPPPLTREAPARQVARESEADLILKRQHDMQERIRQIKESKANISGGAAATKAQVAATRGKTQPNQTAKSGLRQSLRNPREIRKAVIMREILGPPVGLR